MKIVWTDFAIKNLKTIFEYYSDKVNKEIAHKIRDSILKSVKNLIKNPRLGQKVLEHKLLKYNYRYLLAGNYKIVYRIKIETIVIIDIFDMRQDPKNIADITRDE